MRLVCECEYLNAACHWLGKSCLEVLLTKWGCIDWQIPQKNSPTRKVTSSKDKVICRNAKYIVSNIDFGLSCHMQIGSQKSSPEFCPTTGGLCAVHVFLAPASTINTSYWFSTRSLWTARNFVSVSSANSSAAVPAEVLHFSLRTDIRRFSC